MSISIANAVDTQTPTRGLLLLALARERICSSCLPVTVCCTIPDTFWQIKVGGWIMEHRAVPHSDLYSFTKFGAPWISTSWLSQVLYAAVHSQWGWAGPVILASPGNSRNGCDLRLFSYRPLRGGPFRAASDAGAIAVIAPFFGASSRFGAAGHGGLGWSDDRRCRSACSSIVPSLTFNGSLGQSTRELRMGAGAHTAHRIAGGLGDCARATRFARGAVGLFCSLCAGGQLLHSLRLEHAVRRGQNS